MNGFCAIFIMAAGGILAQNNNQEIIAYHGATIHTAMGEPITNGVLVIQGNKILGVGRDIPANAKKVDLSGMVIIPGLVDTHSHLGLFGRPQVPANSDGNEASGPVQSSLRAMDAISPQDPGIRMALSGGVTTANIMPGSGNVIGGQTLYVKLRGNTVEEMRISDSPILGGLKMANGENPKRFNFDRNKSAPNTRMKVMALQREQFLKAREYQRKWAEFNSKKEGDTKITQPEKDLSLEPLVEVLERKRTVHFHCHRADDIFSALRLAKEFGFEIIFQHGTEGYRIAEVLGKEKAMVSLTLVDSPGGKAEVAGLLEENAARLANAGVLVAINTDDPVTESRFLLRTGSIAHRGGMTEDQALAALTINPARMMHLEKKVGSLEVGKDADFVVLSGAPFSVYTQVMQTFIEGKRVFDRANQKDWSYQSGGFALAEAGKQLPAVTPPVAAISKVVAPKATNGTIQEGERPAKFAIRAGRIHVVNGTPITDGVIVVDSGKVLAVGKSTEVKIPEGIPVLAAAEVTPGLIDSHTSVGLAGALNIGADQDQDEITDPNQADIRVLDGINPNEALLEFLRRQGVTVVHVVPGPSNVVAGQTGVFRAHGNTVEAMTIRFPAGLMINLGETPKKTYPGKAPTTRMATAALLRNEFSKGRDHARKRAAETDPAKRDPKPKLDPFADAVEGKLPVLFAAHRADDIQTALRLTKEFGLKARLDEATEAYLIPEEIRQSKIPIVLHPTMQRVGRMETFNTRLGSALSLGSLGNPLAIGSGYEDYVPKTRVIRHEAAMAMANGLPYANALSAITLDAAKILGVEKDFGSIEVGKQADLVLYDGDPFEHKTQVQYTFIGGRLVYSRPDYLKLPFERRALPLLGGASGGCCIGW
ncbi:MAG: amidohydrolase family protein [Gemmataceae bacterium]